MKCAICNEKTTWDESYGLDEFIVCPLCHNRLGKHNIKNYPQVIDFIFECGYIRREKKEQEKLK